MTRTEELEAKLANLPIDPGVYQFKDAEGRIIYIGKAKNLRNRVRTYFHASHHPHGKTGRMISKVADVDLMVTGNEVEALILEANLVREHKPRYNVDLKDDKHFPYIKITTNEPFPRVMVVRRLDKDGATCFGPYTSSRGMRGTVALLTQMFKIRTCNLAIPHPKGKEQKVCLDYYIKRCGGPCEGLQSEEDYREKVDAVIMVLSGKAPELIEQLQARMNVAAEAMEYEDAMEYRDQIEAVRSVMRQQHVDIGEMVDRDIIALAREERDAVTVVMQIRRGALIGRQDFQLVADPDDPDETILFAFLQQYYNKQPNLPGEVYLPFEISESKLVARWLKKIKGSKVIVHTPKRGDKVKLVDLANANARLLLDEMLIQKRGHSERMSKMVVALKDALALPKAPLTVACFDISNTGETDAVGSCVYFENARPKKSEYRHFRIKGVRGQDDFGMMREVVGRYFHRLREEGKTPPDLIVVDGGKGQLSSALGEVKRLGFDQQLIIGLAKRLEEVFLPGRPDSITIDRRSPALMLLKQVRDEAHRFAITYNRKVRDKRTFRSELDGIPGIGPAKRDALIKYFGSVERIRQASVEQLSEVPGISGKLAETVSRALS